VAPSVHRTYLVWRRNAFSGPSESAGFLTNKALDRKDKSEKRGLNESSSF
jgi:hypothetical protein